MTKKIIGAKWRLLLMGFLIVGFSGAVRAQNGGLQVKISLTVKDATMQEVLSQLQKKSGYTFLYKNEDIASIRNINLSEKNKELKALLDGLLATRGLTYEVDDHVIIIKPVKPAAGSRSRSLKGKVTDENGQPLAGTTVQLKGEHNEKVQVQTDREGNYSLELPPGTRGTLVFTFLGMETQEWALGPQERMDIRLKQASTELEEAVIVGGYGLKQKRSDMVGSAYQVTAEQIKTLPVQRIDNLLEGLAPGLQVTYNSDMASSTKPRMNVRIRGEASLNASNEPLWIVDGVRMFTGDRTNLVPGMNTAISPLTYLNAEDIESITVLKDATESSLYGADGANGVILITTKKGKRTTSGDSPGPVTSASVRYGLAKINKTTLFKTLDAQQYLTLAKEAYLNVPGNTDLTYFPYQDLPNNPYSSTQTDWTDVFYGTGTYLQSNLNVSGGGEKNDYYLSGGYFKNGSTIKGNSQQRFSLRGNTDLQLSKKLSMTLQSGVSYNVDDIFDPGTDYYEFLPILSPYNEDGSYRLFYDRVYKAQDSQTGTFYPDTERLRFFNSVAERDQNDNMQRTFLSVNNLVLRWNIMEGLELNSQFGANYQSSHEEIYDARTNWSGMDLQTGDPIGFSTRANASFLLWTAVERLNFNHSFGKHHVNGVLGIEANSQTSKSLSLNGEGFANDYIKEISYAGKVSSGYSNSDTEHKASYLGQINYDYASRYYLSLNARRDGNSDFGADVQWGDFWSIGGSWNIHNEDFFHSDVLKILKLKASYGTNGNSRLGSLQASGVYSFSSTNNYLGNSGAVMSAVWNRQLSWERAYMANIGLRANLWNRVDMELEVYNKRTVDLLNDLDVSRTTGDTRVLRNVGVTQNRGVELNVQSVNIAHDKFSWRTEANISHNSNKLVKLYNGLSKVLGNQILTEGDDINTFFLVRWAGVDPRDGAPLWYDQNGNLTRVFSLNDRVPYKSSSPLFTGGMTNTFTYRNWSLHTLMTYVIGGYSFSSFGRDVSSDGLHLMEGNQSANQLDRWQSPGDLSITPKLIWQQTNANSSRNSTRYLYNTTYLRLKNISLSYQMDPKWLKRWRLGETNVNLLIDNIGLWTPYDHIGRNSYRQAISGYPMETTVSLGLDLHF